MCGGNGLSNIYCDIFVWCGVKWTKNPNFRLLQIERESRKRKSKNEDVNA